MIAVRSLVVTAASFVTGRFRPHDVRRGYRAGPTRVLRPRRPIVRSLASPGPVRSLGSPSRIVRSLEDSLGSPSPIVRSLEDSLGSHSPCLAGEGGVEDGLGDGARQAAAG